jgi:hypothetical protein
VVLLFLMFFEVIAAPWHPVVVRQPVVVTHP